MLEGENMGRPGTESPSVYPTSSFLISRQRERILEFALFLFVLFVLVVLCCFLVFSREKEILTTKNSSRYSVTATPEDLGCEQPQALTQQIFMVVLWR